MLIKVHMLAFGQPGEIREVDVPGKLEDYDLPNLLETVFYLGQNDFQPQPHPSVSAGDVIDFENGTYWVVKFVGFINVNQATFDEYKAIDRRYRIFDPLVVGQQRKADDVTP